MKEQKCQIKKTQLHTVPKNTVETWGCRKLQSERLENALQVLTKAGVAILLDKVGFTVRNIVRDEEHFIYDKRVTKSEG